MLVLAEVFLAIILLRPGPRVFRETAGLRLRIQHGLEFLDRQANANREDAASEGALKFVEIEHEIPSKFVNRRDWVWTLPSRALPAGDLSAFSDVIRDGWGIPGAYPRHGHGGGGSRYELSFGDAQSHAGVLMTAFEQNGTTTIHSQMLAVLADGGVDGVAHGKPDPQTLPVYLETLDRFRTLFTAELTRLCTTHLSSVPDPRQRSRYDFGSPGSGTTGASVRESKWRWVVPAAVLEPDGLRVFADEISRRWDPAARPLEGKDYSFSLTFGDGMCQAFVNIIAVPGTKPGGSPDTVIYYHQLLFDGRQKASGLAKDSPEVTRSLDLELLGRIPGISAREHLANAKLDGQDRRLQRLREADAKYRGTWKIEYILRLTTPLSEAILESFAAAHGMTWKATSIHDPRKGVMRHDLRLFKVMAFSEAELNATTSAVHQLSGDHRARFIGWNYQSDQIQLRNPSHPR